MNARSDVQKDLDEFHEDIAFQRRFWRIERIAWIVFTLLIVTALTGLTGAGGPLAHAHAETPHGTIDYPRVARWQATDDMVIRLAPSAGARQQVELDRRFVENFEIVSIQPQPASSAATPTGMRYGFDVEQGGEVVFQLRALRPAFFPDTFIRIGDAEASVRPLILP